MSKGRKTVNEPIYTSKTKSARRYSSGARPFTRIMAIFLAALMVLGGLVTAVLAVMGVGKTAFIPHNTGAEIYAAAEAEESPLC